MCSEISTTKYAKTILERDTLSQHLQPDCLSHLALQVFQPQCKFKSLFKIFSHIPVDDHRLQRVS